MKSVLTHISLLAIVCSFALTLSACKTDEPGVKSTYRSQYTTVAANTEDATQAAKAVLAELELMNITSSSTGLDGKATAYTADNTEVRVTVDRVDDNTSEISVNIGALGDPSLGKTIISRIRSRLAP